MLYTKNMDAPGVIHGVQDDYKRLFYSDPIAALRIPITLQAGYGLLKMGTVLAVNKSAAGNVAKYVPYNPTTFTGAETHPGRAYLVANSGTTDKFVYVTIDDSYKFAVGDDLIINDDTTTAENLGAITAIDRTSETQRAKITATTAIGGTAFTTARKAYVCVEAGDNSNNYSDAVGILEMSLDTGLGKNCVGAHGSLIWGNCVLYEGMLTLLDSAAKTDLSSTSKGQYLMIR
jgi:hypothetical protein